MKKDIEAYSEDTGKLYPNWDALVAAEAHGYTVLLTSSRPNTYPWMVGLFATKPEALAARVRYRNRAAKAEAPYKVTTRIRILWKGL